MKAVVVYESMYDNTHLVAEAIAEGLRTSGTPTDVCAVAAATEDVIAGADLVVIGGPTHVHGMTREKTRQAAIEATQKPGSTVEAVADAAGVGLREWFDDVAGLPAFGAAFDTRLDGPAAITGRASKGIAKRMRQHGCDLVDGPKSFLVTKETHLLDDELAHARAWGERIGLLRLETSSFD